MPTPNAIPVDKLARLVGTPADVASAALFLFLMYVLGGQLKRLKAYVETGKA